MPEPMKIIIPSYSSFIELISNEERRVNKYASVFCTTFSSDNRLVFYPEDYLMEYVESRKINAQPRHPKQLLRHCELNNIRCISSVDLKSTLYGLQPRNGYRIEYEKLNNILNGQWSAKKEQLLLILTMLYIDRLYKNRVYENKYAITGTNAEFIDNPLFCSGSNIYELRNISLKKHVAY